MGEQIRAAVDVETTGTEPGIHEIVQISIIVFDKNLDPINRFLSYVRPMHPEVVMPEAMAVNKLDINKLLLEPTPSQVRSLFINWKESHYGDSRIRMLGQNVGQFDFQFLRLFFNKDLFHKHFNRRVDDLSSTANYLKDVGLIPQNVETDFKSLLEYFKIVPEKSHDAYWDSLTTLQLLKTMVELNKGRLK